MLAIGLVLTVLTTAGVVVWEYAPLWWPRWTMRWSPSMDHVIRAELVLWSSDGRRNLGGPEWEARRKDGTVSMARILAVARGDGDRARRAALVIPLACSDLQEDPAGITRESLPADLVAAVLALSRHADPEIRFVAASWLHQGQPDQCAALTRLAGDQSLGVIGNVVSRWMEGASHFQHGFAPVDPALVRAVDALCDWTAAPGTTIRRNPGLIDHSPYYLALAGYATMPVIPVLSPVDAETLVRGWGLEALINLDGFAARRRLLRQWPTVAGTPAEQDLLLKLVRCGAPTHGDLIGLLDGNPMRTTAVLDHCLKAVSEESPLHPESSRSALACLLALLRCDRPILRRATVDLIARTLAAPPLPKKHPTDFSPESITALEALVVDPTVAAEVLAMLAPVLKQRRDLRAAVKELAERPTAAP